ncbi:MAG: molybdopterin containing oxidoreductase, partial [Pseudomonadota bacterium]
MKRRGIYELYARDPLAADAAVWGRRSASPDEGTSNRRGFLRGSGLAALSAAVGGAIPFAHLMPAGLIPAALAQGETPFEIPGKHGLVVLNDRPLNAETPAHLLDDPVTSAEHFFVRNNGTPPGADVDADRWTLTIGGEAAERD